MAAASLRHVSFSVVSAASSELPARFQNQVCHPRGPAAKKKRRNFSDPGMQKATRLWKMVGTSAKPALKQTVAHS
eukprot:8581227-Pyramimonas_sp.AAC.1